MHAPHDSKASVKKALGDAGILSLREVDPLYI
jgi:hypothetical protein